MNRLNRSQNTKFDALEKSLIHGQEHELSQALGDYSRKRKLKASFVAPKGGDYNDRKKFYNKGMEKMNELNRRNTENEDEYRRGYRGS